MEVLRGMGLEPVFMPDPTLLLSCDDWSELATGEGLDSIPEEYVLLYTLNSEQKLLERGLGGCGAVGHSRRLPALQHQRFSWCAKCEGRWSRCFS